MIKRVRQCDSADMCAGDERGQCHVPGPDVWRAGRESWRTEAQGMGGEKRSTVSVGFGSTDE